jgi:tellurite resistance protein TehA-like permease
MHLGESEYWAVGATTGGLGILFAPAALIAIVCGVQLYRGFDKRRGTALVVGGVVSFVIGVAAAVVLLAVVAQY